MFYNHLLHKRSCTINELRSIWIDLMPRGAVPLWLWCHPGQLHDVIVQCHPMQTQGVQSANRLAVLTQLQWSDNRCVGSHVSGSWRKSTEGLTARGYNIICRRWAGVDGCYISTHNAPSLVDLSGRLVVWLCFAHYIIFFVYFPGPKLRKIKPILIRWVFLHHHLIKF